MHAARVCLIGVLWLVSVAPLFAQSSAAPPPAADSAASVRVDSIWDFVVKGGIVMIPIGICSLVALAVVAERLIALRRSKVIPPQFAAELRSAFSGRDGRRRALEYCEKDSSPLARVFVAAIRRMHEPREALERQIAQAGEREVHGLRKYMRLLAVITSVSPMLGLLGTIFGMISAFQTVAASGEALGRTELLAKGIYEALITTAAGLIVAVPCLLAHYMLSARVDALVRGMDAQLSEFLDAHFTPVASGVTSASAAAELVALREDAAPLPAAAPGGAVAVAGQ